jgi:hypothetical protein
MEIASINHTELLKLFPIIYVLNVSATFKSRKMSTWKDILISALVRGKGNEHVN